MLGRDTQEHGRAASTLELLFDLAFVVAFSLASGQLAHFIADGHVWHGLAGYAVVLFGIVWAWINYSWFASAFDTDDWAYRLMTFVQMVGVVVFALGIVPLFHSIDPGLHEVSADSHVDLRVTVIGYVIMRIAQIGQWARVAAQSPDMRPTALRYIGFLTAAQVVWALNVVLDLPLAWAVLVGVAAFVIEIAGPVFGERMRATPWHAHHIAERYGLLTIVTIGEAVVGTVISLQALYEAQGFSLDLLVIACAGVGLAFTMWWIYFMLPSAEVLHRERNAKAFVWGYSHVAVFGAVAAVGAGLHAAADSVADPEHVSTLTAVTAVAVPVAIYLVAVTALSAWLVGWSRSRFEVLAMLASLVALAAGVALAAAGLPLALCLLLVMLAPAVQIVADEVTSAQSRERALERFAAQ